MNREHLNKDWKDNPETCPLCGASEAKQDYEGEPVWDAAPNAKEEFWIAQTVLCYSCKKTYDINFVGMLKIECIVPHDDIDGDERLVIDPDGNVVNYDELQEKKKS